MRNIKFRGKSVMTGEWVYGSLISNDDSAFIVESYGDEGTLGAGLNIYDLIWHKVDSDTVGQSLGLWDGNETLVFEGDIIEGLTIRDTYFKGEVVFFEQNNVFGWHIQDKDGAVWKIKSVCTQNSFVHISGRVIGNIHDVWEGEGVV